MRIMSFVALLVLVAGSASAAQDRGIQVEAQKFRPHWQVGQQWTVETVSQQQQAAIQQQSPVKARWQFQVEAVEQLQGKPCWRIAVRPTDAPHPQSHIWVTQSTQAIRQIETELPTPQGYQKITESYQSGGQAAPVVGPLSVLPIALPQFPEPGVKAIGTFQYDTVSGPGGIKAVGEVGFSTEIAQRIVQPSAELLKAMSADEHIKATVNRPLAEVELATPDVTVRQVWRENSPWAVFTDNGVTQARLIDVKPGKRPAQAVPSTTKPDGSKLQSSADDIKALAASGGDESGAAKITPWSGYWWPIHEGRLLVPLGKYDQLTGKRAANWEKQHNPPGPDVPKWHGYCHAWSAAAILETEPARESRFRLDSARLALDLGDQKGLLTACHTEDLANSWGDRFGDGRGSEDPQDMRPDLLWRLLKLHLGQQRVSLVLDVESGEEVWNYPIYQYELHYHPTRGDQYDADLTLLMADDGVRPDYRGTKVRKQTYQFTFKMRRGNVVTGSSQWTGRSKKDHPDFAWYPYKAVAANPEVIYQKVQAFVLAQRPTTPQPAPQPALPTPPQPTPPSPPQPEPPTSPQPVPPTPPQPAPPTPATQPADPPAAPAAQATGPIVLSPMELVALIDNRTSSFEFDATVDRFDGASYRPSERFFVRVTSQRPGYLYLLQVDSSGAPALLFPTAGEDHRIAAGKQLDIKPNNAGGGFPVAGPEGMMRVKAVVTSRPLAFSGSLEPLQTDQAPTQQRLAQQSQVQPVPQRQQVKELLAQGQAPVKPAQLGCRPPQEFLGPFAQDLTMFYIDTKARADAPDSAIQKPPTGKRRKR